MKISLSLLIILLLSVSAVFAAVGHPPSEVSPGQFTGNYSFSTDVCAGGTCLASIGSLSSNSLDAADGTPTNAVYVDDDGRVGIGTTSPNRNLHVQQGSAGSVNASANSQLVLESSGHAGIHILSPDTNQGLLYFGTPSDDIGAQINWDFNNGLMTIGTHNSGAEIEFYSGAASPAMRIDDLGNVGIGTTSPGEKLTVIGRINATTDVCITGGNCLSTDNWVNTGGDTMTADLSMGSNQITNLGAPISESDAATKLYVDALGGSGSSGGYTSQGSGIEYLGRTTSTYNGYLGGYNEMSERCEIDYGEGARMMTTDDLKNLGADAPTTNGWYHCSNGFALGSADSSAYFYCEGAYRGGSTYEQYDYLNCDGWADASSRYAGYNPTDLGLVAQCTSSYNIHCVRDGYAKYFAEGGSPYFCSKETLSQKGYVDSQNINEGQQCQTSPDKYCNHGTCYEDVNDTYMIYVASGTIAGNRIKRESADEFCRDNIPDNVECGNIHAMVSFSSGDEIRDMPTKYYSGMNYSAPVYWAYTSNGTLTMMAYNWSDMLDSSILSYQSAGTGYNVNTWSFSLSTGAIDGSAYCATEYSSGTYGRNSLTGQWLDYSDQACSGSLYIKCFCQGFE